MSLEIGLDVVMTTARPISDENLQCVWDGKMTSMTNDDINEYAKHAVMELMITKEVIVSMNSAIQVKQMNNIMTFKDKHIIYKHVNSNIKHRQFFFIVVLNVIKF